MTDPIRLGTGTVIDRAAVKAVHRENGRVLVFFGGERPMILDDTFSAEELKQLTEKTE